MGEIKELIKELLLECNQMDKEEIESLREEWISMIYGAYKNEVGILRLVNHICEAGKQIAEGNMTTEELKTILDIA